MEEFVKSAVENIISNYSAIKFNNLPVSLKRTYCKKHLGFDDKESPGYKDASQCLIDDLDKTDDLKFLPNHLYRIEIEILSQM